MTRRLLAAALLAALAHAARAQQLIGTVRGSAGRQPVPGAVIL